jgi:hypothetical protein
MKSIRGNQALKYSRLIVTSIIKII